MITHIPLDKKAAGYDAYRIDMAMRLHFSSSSYNAFTYNFSVKNATVANFEKLGRGVGLKYDRLAQVCKYQNTVVHAILENILRDKTHISGYEIEGAADKWISRIQRMDYTLESDINNLLKEAEKRNMTAGPLSEVFVPSDPNEFPLIYTVCGSSYETLAGLDLVLKFTTDQEKILGPHDKLGVTTAIASKVRAYTPFVSKKVNIGKITEMLLAGPFSK